MKNTSIKYWELHHKVEYIVIFERSRSGVKKKALNQIIRSEHRIWIQHINQNQKKGKI